jgi:hypothetical protein
MKQARRVLAVLLFAISTSVTAQSQAPSQADDAVAIVRSGFVAYQSGGADAGVKEWIKGSPLEGNKDALAQANSLKQIEEIYGPLRSWELIAKQPLGTQDCFYYVVISYGEAAVYGKFEVFDSPKGWTLDSFSFNTDINKEFPQSLLDNSIVMIKPPR